MPMSRAKVTDFVVTNGAKLYYERQGVGQGLLFIAGSTGDAGNFTRTAHLLSDEFTVVTYDRRGNSRSPRPAGWTTTSVSEQADDAAGLIQTLRLAPVALFAASAGALIGLDLVLRHPQLVRGAVLQEPSLFSVLPDPDAALAPRRALVQNALRSGGPRAVVEALLRYLNDDDVLRVIPADILERMLANADTIVNLEGAFAQWRPPAEALAAVTVPITLMVARETKPEYVAVVRWLERRLDARTITIPGRHGFYYYRPQDLADAVRPVFKELTAA